MADFWTSKNGFHDDCKPSQRIVFEIDGIQHYAEDEIALGNRYKRYASPAKYAEIMKAHRKMSLTGYDVYRFCGRELWANDNNFEADMIKYVEDFFDRLFKNII